MSFSPVFAFYFHQVSTQSSFKHNTFYIWDVLCSYFLIVFSKKAKMQKQNINLFLMTWVQWLCSLLYLWETILYILALDSLNWRTWQIPLEHNEYVKKKYIHKVIFCKMYHSNKLLLVKTNMSGLYVRPLFTLHNVSLKIVFFLWHANLKEGIHSFRLLSLAGLKEHSLLVERWETMLYFHCPVWYCECF